MTSDVDRAIRTMNEAAEKMKKFQKLSKKGAAGLGSITHHENRLIVRSVTRMGKLLKQIEAVSPGFLETFKGKLPDIKK